MFYRRAVARLALVTMLWAGAAPDALSQIVLDAITAERPIDGGEGGSVTNGRWMVRVTPGAYEGVGRIRVVTRLTRPGQCSLEIEPADKNAFQVPVVLVFRFPRGSDLEGYRIQRFEPSKGVWVDVPGCTQNSAAGEVTAPLDHFSDYRILGRSGW